MGQCMDQRIALAIDLTSYHSVDDLSHEPPIEQSNISPLLDKSDRCEYFASYSKREIWMKCRFISFSAYLGSHASGNAMIENICYAINNSGDMSQSRSEYCGNIANTRKKLQAVVYPTNSKISEYNQYQRLVAIQT